MQLSRTTVRSEADRLYGFRDNEPWDRPTSLVKEEIRHAAYKAARSRNVDLSVIAYEVELLWSRVVNHDENVALKSMLKSLPVDDEPTPHVSYTGPMVMSLHVYGVS